MITRRVNMEEDWGVSIDCNSAVADQNPVMHAAQLTLLAPYALALQMERLPEERAWEIWARLYAEAVIMGSPTPVFERFTKDEWVEWLLREREAFIVLRSVCEAPDNFRAPEVPWRAEHPAGPPGAP